MSVQCARTDCRNNATHRLEFRLMLTDGGEVPGQAGLYVCRQHATEDAATEVFEHEPGREQLEQEFASRGLPTIDWAQSRAVWIALPLLN